MKTNLKFFLINVAIVYVILSLIHGFFSLLLPLGDFYIFRLVIAIAITYFKPIFKYQK